MKIARESHECSAQVYGSGSYSTYHGHRCQVPAIVQRTRIENVSETVKVYDEATFMFSTERRDLGTKDVVEWFCSRHDPIASQVRQNKKDATARATYERERNMQTSCLDAGAAVAAKLKAVGVSAEQAWYTDFQRKSHVRPALTINYSEIEKLLARLAAAEQKKGG